MASNLKEQSTEVASEVESTERVMKIKVCEWGTERTIDLCVTEEQVKRITVLQLKKKIESLFGLPVRDQLLVIDGEQLVGGQMVLCIDTMLLEDDRLLSDYGIKDGSTIHVLKDIISGGFQSGGWSGGGGMGDREGRNQSMECVAIMLTGSDVSSEAAPHPQPAAVEDLPQD